MPSNAKKPRKQRTIYNSVVDIDDVEIGPGIAFANWKFAAMQKLKKRELILLKRRQEICNNLIVSAVQTFFTDNSTTFNIYKHHLCVRVDRLQNDTLNIYQQQIQHQITNSNSKIMSQCIQSIDNIFSKWNGFKSEKMINKFRQYYQGSRRWFDLKKIETLVIAFWIPITKTIEEFVQTAAAHTFCNTSSNLQKAFADYLSLYVSKHLLGADMKHFNARSMFLIPAISYKTFIKRSHLNLNVRCFAYKEKDKDIRSRYMLSIYRKISSCQRSFETELEELEELFNINELEELEEWTSIPPQININAFLCGCCCNNNNNSASHSNIFGTQVVNTDWTLELNEPCDKMFQSPSPPYLPLCGSPNPMMFFGN